MMASHVKTLWILECAEGKCGQLFTFYALDEQDAEKRTEQILTAHPHLKRRELCQQPCGFVMMHERIPGQITEEENTQPTERT